MGPAGALERCSPGSRIAGGPPAARGARSTARARARAPPRPRAARTPYPPPTQELPTDAPTDVLYDAVIVGGGMGGLTTAAKLVEKGAKVLVLEKYLVPGGSAAHFKRAGYTFDVGSSMMFGFGDQGTTNLITKALEAVGRRMETIPDPTQVHYHLPRSAAHPDGLSVRVWRAYGDFLAEMERRFPAEREGVRKFYDECWRVFNALNSLELKSLEEPRYLMGEFFKDPASCLTLASYLITNTGDVAKRYIKDPELLRFIDAECYIWSTVNADLTPMINAGMVFCDRHFGGINYPKGGVGLIGEEMAAGIEERGGRVIYKANVKEIITEAPGPRQGNGNGEPGAGEGGLRAVGIRLADGREYRARTVVSNATRWDTFEHMLGEDKMPEDEKLFRQRYKKAPSFFSLHLGVDASVFEAKDGRPAEEDCHHIILEDWTKMEDSHGTLFVSLPSLLDPSLAPPGKAIVHAFTPDWIDAWQGLDINAYEAKKQDMADALIARLDAQWPGLAESISFREVGTPRTHRRFLNRDDGTYGPVPSRRPLGMLSMPFNRTSINGLYCVGDSTFPGQGVNAVVFSGFGAAHRVAVDIGMEPGWPVVDTAFNKFLSYIRDRS